MHTFLQKTAWTMEVPRPYSSFHLLYCSIGIVLAVFFARSAAVRFKKSPATPLFFSGLILAAGELYKQLFLYEIVNHFHYDWWYFPLQLCSTPMYLCIISLFMHRQSTLSRTVATYLQDFGLLGGIMALLEPSGLLYPYVTLTLHGLTWHILLIFIGVYCHKSGLAGTENAAYAKTLPLLAVFLILASIVNIATRGQADMFYISPFYPVNQVFFYQISLILGTPAGIALYLFSICLGGYIIHYCLGKL